MAADYTVSGNLRGKVSAASAAFTLTKATGTFDGSKEITITVTDGSITAISGGTVSTIVMGQYQMTPNNGVSVCTFAYTPAATGTKTLAFTNSFSGTDPASLTYNSIKAWDPANPSWDSWNPSPEKWDFIRSGGWVDLFIQHYSDYCKAFTRTTKYYFSTSGDDTTGNGSQGNPYKTRSKANALAGDYVELSFKCGDSWDSETTVTIGDSGHTAMKVSAWGDTALGRPIFKTFGTAFGTDFSGDGAWVDGIYCESTGNDSSGSGGTFQLSQHGTGVGLVTNCQGVGGQKHCMWGLAAGASGGIWLFQNCLAGANGNAAGGAWISYSETGGSTIIIDGCTGTSGSPNGASPCVFGHTGSGLQNTFITRNLLVKGTGNPFSRSVDFAYGALTADPNNPADIQAYEIGTVMEKQDGNSAMITQPNAARINCHWSLKTNATNGNQNLQLNAGGWCWNSTLEYDNGGGYGHEYIYLSFSGGAVTAKPNIWNCRINVTNVTYDWGFDDLAEQGVTGQNRFAGGSFINNIVTSGPSGAGGLSYIGMEGITSDGNAVRGFTNSFGAYQTDAHRVDLAAIPAVNYQPVSGDGMYGASKALPGGIVLAYDQTGHPRNLNGSDKGPLQRKDPASSLCTVSTGVEIAI